MLQNKFNETQFQFFFLFIRRIFFQRTVVKIKKKKSTKYCKKKTTNKPKKNLPWNSNMSIKKINCNLYAVRL